MGSGDHNGARLPEELVANHFRQRREADLAIEHFLQLGVTARDGIADDDELDVRGDALGAVPLECLDAFPRQEIAHRRVHTEVRALNRMSAGFQHRRQCGHRGPADADEVDSHVISPLRPIR